MMSDNSVYRMNSGPKSRPTCFLCDSRTGLSARNVVKIFDVLGGESADGTSPADILASVLQRPINEENAHSQIICKKCQGICSEYQDALSCLNNIKQSIIDTFNVTAAKLNLDTSVASLDSSVEDQLRTENVSLFTVDFNTNTGEVESTVDEENVNNSDVDSKLMSNDNNVVVFRPNSKSKRRRMQKNVFIMNDINNIVNDCIEEESTEPDQRQEPTYQTVILEDVDDTDYTPQESHEAIIIGDSVMETNEYFEGNEEQMIEISTDAHEKAEDYETTFVFEDEVASITSEDPNDHEHMDEGVLLTENVKDKLSATNSTLLKGETDESLASMSAFEVKVEKSDDADGDVTGDADYKQTPIFMREGMDFRCQLCNNNVVYDAKTIAIHMKTDHGERIYVCDICGADFRKRNHFNDHLDDHSAECKDGEYRCAVCEGVFASSRQLRLHKKSHSMCVKIWSCKECNKNYSSKNLLDEHMNMHTGERPYKCPHCTKDFASKYTLTAHMKTHYERKRPYECKECNKSFFSNQNLTQHERTHSGIKDHVCDICNKAFGTPHNLEVHKIVHTGHKPFICRICGKAFARRAEIKDHERTHTGERPYKCDMCSASFAQRSNLMSHKRATHFDDKRYKCDICERSFKRRRLLEYHIRASHTGERPYRCDTCGSTFVYPEHYKKHLRIHSGVKPFSCEVCGKAFNSRDNRNAHRFVHSEKKPYECMVCGTGFMRKPLLYTHMSTMNHVNDQIVINQPHIGEKVDEQGNGIIYLSQMNAEEMLEDDYNAFEEENIVEEGEVINEEDHLIIDHAVHFGTGDGSHRAMDQDEQGELTSGNEALYITEDGVFEDGDDESGESKKATGDDTVQYKYVFFNRMGNEVMPLESV